MVVFAIGVALIHLPVGLVAILLDSHPLFWCSLHLVVCANADPRMELLINLSQVRVTRVQGL